MPTFRRLFESRLFASLGCVCEPPAAAAPRKGWDTDDPPEASTSCLPDIGASKAYGAIPNDKLDKAPDLAETVAPMPVNMGLIICIRIVLVCVPILALPDRKSVV